MARKSVSIEAPQEWFTVEEAASYLRVSKRTIYKWSNNGCRWSAIRSVGNRSGKMSVDERTDIDYERADKIVHHECGVGTTVER